jgi:hypothetical protein
MVYYHVLATWDELSLEEREMVLGFQTGITNHTKVIRLEHNALLGRHGPELPYMVVGNMCTLSNVHNTNIDSTSLQLWQCDYMTPRPSTLAHFQHFTFHS